MTGSWLHPMYAWGLLTLLIPLAIHLWNRKQGKLIRVGSIQLVSASESARASRLRLHEIGLWLLRSALAVALVALLMGWEQPQSKQTDSAPTVWHVVDPTVADFLPEGILSETEGAYWLGNSLNALTKPPPAPGDAWASLLSLGKQPSPPDTVFVYTTLHSQRWPIPAPPLPFAVEWKDIPQPTSTTTLIQQWNQNRQARQWQSVPDEYTVQIRQEMAPRTDSESPMQLRIHVNIPEQEKVILEQALRTVAEYLRINMVIVTSVVNADLAFWWPEGAPVPSDSLRVVTWEEKANLQWWTPHTSQPNHLLWHHPIQFEGTEKPLWASLPTALIELLLPTPQVPHPVAAATLTTQRLAADTSPTLADKSGTLLLLVIVLLITERSLAAWRKS
ncbi:MAG: BatA domain-containing protein [Bacteroidota bacterium]